MTLSYAWKDSGWISGKNCSLSNEALGPKVMESLLPEVFKNYVDVALRDMPSDMVVVGQWLDWMTLLVFSKLNGSVIL